MMFQIFRCIFQIRFGEISHVYVAGNCSDSLWICCVRSLVLIVPIWAPYALYHQADIRSCKAA